MARDLSAPFCLAREAIFESGFRCSVRDHSDRSAATTIG
jgi:hypothetical protein